MTYLQALILGVVEGLTEFLPVSSTGHLILTNSLLGLQGEAAKNYTIVIQFGAIMAVVALYKDRALEMLRGLMGKDSAGLGLFLKLIVAFLPAAVIGKLLDDIIDAHLMAPLPVVGALVVGGIAMIVVENFVVKPRARKDGEESLRKVEQMTFLDAFIVGCGQCLALWPGTSRSMATIVTAQLRGFSSVAAAEFSFLLAMPTLGAATAYKLLKHRHDFMAMEGGVGLILFGNMVAFVVAFVAVIGFVRVVTKFGMTPFGIYRILIGFLFLSLWLMGTVQM